MNFLHSQKGSLLLMAVLILTSVMSVSLTAASLAMSGAIISGSQVRSVQAYFAADAGIEQALAWARSSVRVPADLASSTKNVVLPTLPSGDPRLSNGATYKVDYTTWANIRNFSSRGEFNNMRRTVEVQYGYVAFENIIDCSADRLDLCENQTECVSVGGTWNIGDNICE